MRQTPFTIELPVLKSEKSMFVEVAGRKQDAVENRFWIHLTFVPAKDLGGAMTPILALFVCPMSLAIVVGHPFAVRHNHPFPRGCQSEFGVGHSSDDVDYVEYSRHLLKTLQEEGARSPHNASYVRIFQIPHNIQVRLDVIFPGLPLIDAFLFNAQCRVDIHRLVTVEDTTAIAHNRFGNSRRREGSEKHLQVVPLILGRRNFACQHRSRVVLQDTDQVDRSLHVWNPMLLDVSDIDRPVFMTKAGFKWHFLALTGCATLRLWEPIEATIEGEQSPTGRPRKFDPDLL